MYSSWAQHLPENEKEDFQRLVWRAKPVLDRVTDLINAEVRAIDDTERDPKAYDNPSWAYKQAYKNGLRTGFSKIKEFVDLNKQQKPKDDR
jgi:hypothetical protein